MCACVYVGMCVHACVSFKLPLFILAPRCHTSEKISHVCPKVERVLGGGSLYYTMTSFSDYAYAVLCDSLLWECFANHKEACTKYVLVTKD